MLHADLVPGARERFMPMRKSPDERTRMMRAFKSENTAPEMAVRRLVYELGYRYRLHRRDLPGKPDMVFAAKRKIIFIHGCFWHSHGCSLIGAAAIELTRQVLRDIEDAVSKISVQGDRYPTPQAGLPGR